MWIALIGDNAVKFKKFERSQNIPIPFSVFI